MVHPLVTQAHPLRALNARFVTSHLTCRPQGRTSNILVEHTPPLRRTIIQASRRIQTTLPPLVRARRSLLISRPGTDPAHTACLRRITERVQPLLLLLPCSMHFLIISVVDLSLPAPTSAPSRLYPCNAHIAISSPTIRTVARVLQPKLLLLVAVAACFVAHAGIPGFVRVERSEASSVVPRAACAVALVSACSSSAAVSTSQ